MAFFCKESGTGKLLPRVSGCDSLAPRRALAQSAHWRPAGPPVCHTELWPEDSIGVTGSPHGSRVKHSRTTCANPHATQWTREFGVKMNTAGARLMAAF